MDGWMDGYDIHEVLRDELVEGWIGLTTLLSWAGRSGWMEMICLCCMNRKVGERLCCCCCC